VWESVKPLCEHQPICPVSARLRAPLAGPFSLSVDRLMPDDGARHGAAEAVRAASGASGLKRDCLSYVEVLAQSVSVIAPSTVPAAILGLIFATAGNGTWLAFLLGMVGLVLVSLNVNEFARRSASSGSLYTYIVQGLGPTAGVMSGWALSFAYMLTGMSTLCGFGIYAEQM